MQAKMGMIKRMEFFLILFFLCSWFRYDCAKNISIMCRFDSKKRAVAHSIKKLVIKNDRNKKGKEVKKKRLFLFENMKKKMNKSKILLRFIKCKCGSPSK